MKGRSLSINRFLKFRNLLVLAVIVLSVTLIATQVHSLSLAE